MSAHVAPPLVYAGVLISLEGVDGCGKSTQIELLQQALSERGCTPVCVREPGGTAISEKIRSIVLDPQNSEMSAECELLLYEASRAQLVRQTIEPALVAGHVVLCDRFFDSTTAYQAYGRGLDLELVNKANELGSCGLIPDLTVILDLDSGLALERATRERADRMEEAGNTLMRRVAQGYRSLAATDRRFHVLDARVSVQELHEQIMALVDALLDERALTKAV